MASIGIKQKLIKKIRSTNDEKLLEEACRLFEIESEDLDVYILNDSQLDAIQKAREQIKSGNILSQDEADKEIDEWLRG